MSEPFDRVYASWKLWDRREFGVRKPSDEAAFEAELRRFDIEVSSGTKLLEVGFGNGEFAMWARNLGADVHGTEMIPQLREQAANAGIHVLEESSPLAPQIGPGTVDVVVAFDVLEHIDPAKLRPLLVDIHRCLKPGGCILARVPSGDSPFSGAIQHGDLTHRSVLGSSAVRQLASAAGFERVEIREPALPLRGAGCLGAVRRILVRAGRRIAFPVIARVFMGGGSPILTPNMIFVLRRP